MHEYTSQDIEKCLQCKKLLFAGDSTIRRIFWATARKLDNSRANQAEQEYQLANMHIDHNFSIGCSKLEFLWDPFLNSSTLREELQDYQARHAVQEPYDNMKTEAAAILVGSGLWQARYNDTDSLGSFKETVDRVLHFLPQNTLTSPRLILPPFARGSSANLMLFAPVMTPYYQKLHTDRAATLRPEKLLPMNQYLQDLQESRSLEVLWSYSLMTHHSPAAYEENGIHVVDDIALRQSDVLLNMRCNGEPQLQNYPFDKTCCAGSAPVNRSQAILLGLGVITFAAWCCALTLVPSLKMRQCPNQTVGLPRILAACGVVAGAIIYCYVADRTTLFEKLGKASDPHAFMLMASITMSAGLMTMAPSDTAARLSCKEEVLARDNQAFLSRNQTDEWKGWMQVLVLIYHYTGTSKVLWIYQIIRLLVASYLFMTGFGHTVFFYKTNDFSFRRVALVLVRLNLLSSLLAYTMQVDYDFYYFPALTSFWFLVIYFTVRLGHSSNTVPRFLILKIILSAILVKAVIHAPELIRTICKVLKLTCNANVDAQEFRFRVSLDIYAVYAGMLFAVLYLQLSGAAPCSTRCLATCIKKTPRLAQILATTTSLVVLPVYFMLARRSPDRYDYNCWHPIVSPFPILAFVMLRNATQQLRNYHCRLFAWFGRCSLETFVLQYHIWLAADAKALLSLGLLVRRNTRPVSMQSGWAHWLEFVIITVLFLWTSWGVSDATNILTSCIVPSAQDDSHSLRSLLCQDVNGNTYPIEHFGQPLDLNHVRADTMDFLRSLDTKPPSMPKMTRLWRSAKLRVALILAIMWIANWVRYALRPMPHYISVKMMLIVSVAVPLSLSWLGFYVP